MSETPVNTLTCTQCGGELNPDEGQIFLTCPYCGATIYLDPGQVVLHWYLSPTLDEELARGALNRWMSGNQTVKDLDKKAQVTGHEYQFFPLWYFIVSENEHEVPALEAAAAISVTEVTRLDLPAGDLRPNDPANDAQAISPTVPLETAQGWLTQKRPGAKIKQSSLVHVPIYIFHYTFKGRSYTALVEAATGRVLANIYPAKAEGPYMIAGGVTALVYLCLAVVALTGLQAGGFRLDVGVAILLAILVAPVLFFMAVMVASRV